jgi:tight adherence protein C
MTMVLLFLVGVVTLGVGAMLALRAFTVPQLRVVAQLRHIKAYGFDEQASAIDRATTPRPLARLAERVGRSAIARLPGVKPLERRALMAAGMYDGSVETFHGYRLLAATGLPALILLFSIAGSGSLTIVPVLMAVVLGVIAWVFPAAHVRTRAQRRLDRIDRDLPELIDILTVTIEAGLGFGGSLQLVSGRFEGPLGDEIRLALQEQQMGLSTQASLTNLLDRCDTPSVRSFVRAVLQGDSLGVSIGTMLRNVATEARKRRRALARERAMKAPVKLLFPLVFLIFPSMFIVLGYPAAYRLFTTLGH